MAPLCEWIVHATSNSAKHWGPCDDSHLNLLVLHGALSMKCTVVQFRNCFSFVVRFCVFISCPATMWGPAIVLVCIVCPSKISLSLANISETKQDRPLWLLGNCFPIQNLPSDSRPASTVPPFHHCGRNRKWAFQWRLGIVTGLCVIWLKFCVITYMKVA